MINNCIEKHIDGLTKLCAALDNGLSPLDPSVTMDDLFSDVVNSYNYFPREISAWYKENYKNKILKNPMGYIDFYGKNFIKQLGVELKRGTDYLAENIKKNMHCASVLYAYYALNDEALPPVTSMYIERLMVIDLFGAGMRTDFILDNLLNLGCSQQQIDKTIDTLMTKLTELFKVNDAELSFIVYSNDVLMDSIRAVNGQSKIDLIAKLLDGLDKKTISPKTFPCMARLISFVIRTLPDSAGQDVRVIKGKELFYTVAKMAAKPKFIAEDCMEDLLLQLLDDYSESVDLQSLMHLSNALMNKPERLKEVTGHPLFRKTVQEDPDFVAKTFMKICRDKNNALQLSCEMKIPLSTAQKNILKTKMAKLDFGL